MDFIQLARLLMRRVYPLLVGLVLGALSCMAYAASPTKVWPDLSTDLAACNASHPSPLTCYIESYPAPSPPLSDLRSVRWTSTTDPTYGWREYTGWKVPTLVCLPGNTAPDTSKPESQQCPDPPKSCAAPWIEKDGKCEDPCKDQAGQTVSGWIDATKSAINVCAGVCEATIDDGSNQYKSKGPAGVQVVSATWHKTGSMGICDPQAVANSSNPPADVQKDQPGKESPKTCADKGQSWFEMNAVTVCIKADVNNPLETKKTTTATKTTTVTNPDGSTENKNQVVTTKTTTVDNGDGDPDVTTTTTVTDSNGNKTDSTSQQKQSTFCQDSPNSPICKKSTYIESDCTSGMAPMCDGDAVQCAAVSQMRQLRCAMTEKTASGDLGLAISSGLDPDKAGLPSSSTASEIDVSQPLQDAAANGGVLGSGQCIPDRTVSVLGHSVIFPFAQTCPYFELIGNVVIGAAMFGAMFIIGRT